MTRRRCTITGETFTVSELELSLLRSFDAPLPTISPAERQRQRAAYRNFRHLYRRSCSASGRPIVSMYHADQPFPVFESSAWWSDDWDPLDYGRQYDPGRSFLDQYHELAMAVPRFAVATVNCENSQYANFAMDSKSCYLVFGCVRNEACCYGHIVWDCECCIDMLYAFRCQWCSHGIDVVDCHEVHFAAESTSCRDSYFLYDCQGCSHCFACFGLRNEEHCFFNERCSPEEYRQRLGRMLPLTHDRIAACSGWVRQGSRTRGAVPHLFGVRNEDVSGNHLYESRKLEACYDMKRCETCTHCYTGFNVENSSDISFTGHPGARFCYHCLTLMNTERALCSQFLQNCHDVAYSEFCFGCRDLLGCTGLRKAAGCILNRRYSADEYHALRATIIADMKRRGEWGEFFPASHSPFAYNESIAAEYQPLSRAEIEARGLRWREPTVGTETAGAIATADAGALSDENLLRTALLCEETNRPFRMQPSELEFLRARMLPLPRQCPDVRLTARMALRPPRELFSTECATCRAPLRSALAHEHRAVLCECCYTRHVRDS